MRLASSFHALMFSTLIVVTGCFSLVLGLHLTNLNFSEIISRWNGSHQVIVYLDPQATQITKEEVLKQIEKLAGHPRVRYISQDEVIREYQAELSTYMPELSIDPELIHLIPGSFEIQLDEKQSYETVKEIALQMRSISGVEDVSFGQEWVQRMGSWIGVIKSLLGSIAILLLISSILIISNMMSNLTSHKRDEIEIMEMLGASFLQIRRPFLFRGAAIGVLAMFFAIFITWAIHSRFRTILENASLSISFNDSMAFLSPLSMLLALLLGAFIGALSSYISVRRINNGHSPLKEGHLWV